MRRSRKPLCVLGASRVQIPPSPLSSRNPPVRAGFVVPRAYVPPRARYRWRPPEDRSRGSRTGAQLAHERRSGALPTAAVGDALWLAVTELSWATRLFGDPTNGNALSWVSLCWLAYRRRSSDRSACHGATTHERDLAAVRRPGRVGVLPWCLASGCAGGPRQRSSPKSRSPSRLLIGGRPKRARSPFTMQYARRRRAWRGLR